MSTTSSIIDELLKLEALPQSRLEAIVASEKSVVATLQALHTKLALLGSTASALVEPTGRHPLDAGTVEGLVGAVDRLLSDIDAQTTYDAASTTVGLLVGDPTVCALRGKVLDCALPIAGASLSEVGIRVERRGPLTFDPAIFSAAQAADPADVERRLASPHGFASRLSRVAEDATNPLHGALTASIAARLCDIARIQAGIEDWRTRLDGRRATLTRQYAALEKAFAQMSTQATWLAGQLVPRPTGAIASPVAAPAATAGPTRSRQLQVERWQLELDRLELDVVRAERAFSTDGVLCTDVWEVPHLSGPLPESLHRRAAEVLSRQEALLLSLAERLGTTPHRHASQDGGGPGHDHDHEVQLDISA